ncbi:hypothetical protein Hanom_Chr00s000465g01645261 [Helianthus anomalus]
MINCYFRRCVCLGFCYLVFGARCREQDIWLDLVEAHQQQLVEEQDMLMNLNSLEIWLCFRESDGGSKGWMLMVMLETVE